MATKNLVTFSVTLPHSQLTEAVAEGRREQLREKYELTIGGSFYQAAIKHPYLTMMVETTGKCPRGFSYGKPNHSYCPFATKKRVVFHRLAEHMLDYVVEGQWEESQFAAWLETYAAPA